MTIFPHRIVFRRFGLLTGLLVCFILCFAYVSGLESRARAARQDKPQDFTIHYLVTPNAEADPPHIVVEMRLNLPKPQESVRVQMPVWSPGDYHYQRHAKYVQNVRAHVEGKSETPLEVEREDENTWRIAPQGNRSIIITYTVPNTSPGFFSENVKVDRDHTFVNPPAALMYVVGHKEDAATITLPSPEGTQVEMPLPMIAARPPEPRTTFAAANYDEMADSPLVIGRKDAVTVRDFKHNGKPHRAVFFGNVPRNMDVDGYVPVLKRIIQAETQIMGGTPYPRYTFFFDVGGRGGGLEHTNSSRMAINGESRPERAVGFIAHEFFHLWNVKRIRPRVLGPFDYINPPKTRNLWFAEGVTEYYAQIGERRAGFSSEADFRDHWREAIRWYNSNPARRKVSADESSLRVWEANNSSGYGGLNYYQKGELIGLCLDLKIRNVTNNRHSLDDVMRELFRRTQPPKPGYAEDEIREVVNQVAGQDLSVFYDLLARSTEEMPFAECLGYAGLDINGKPLPNATPEQVALRKSWAQ